MYSVSANFKQECKQDVNAYKRIAKIHVVEDNIDITNDDNLVDFTIEEMAYSENTFVGNSVAKKINLNIINNGTYNLENKEIEVYVGIDYAGDGSNAELVPCGNFIISKPTNEEVKDKSNYVGYDYMIKTETPYVETNIVYPMSLYNYLGAICTTLGITLGNVSIPNGNYQVLGNAYTNGESFRRVIEEIAKCCGGFAVIGRDNKLYIRTLTLINNNEDETITTGEYFEDFNKNNKYGPVNRVAIALTYNVIGEDTILEDAESIVQDGLTAIRVSDISFLNSEAQRELVIQDFWSHLHNIAYVPFSGNYYGYPYLDTGDIIKITLPDNSNVYSYVFNHKFTYNGGFSGNIDTPALSDVEKQYDYSPTAKSGLRNTELRVDKINGEITSIVNEIGDRSDKQTSITQDIDSIELTVSDLEDLTLEVQGLNPIQLDNCMGGELIGLRIFGNNTIFDGLVPDTNLAPGNSLVPMGSSILKIYTDNNCPTSNEAWEKEQYNMANDLIVDKTHNRYITPLSNGKFALYYHSGYWFMYLECKPNTKYELVVPEKYSQFRMSIGSFEENMLDIISQSTDPIYTDHYDSNTSYKNGAWIYDYDKKIYSITTGSEDKYLVVKYDIPQLDVVIHEVGENNYKATSVLTPINRSQTTYFTLKGYGYYYLTDILYYDENEEYLGNYEDNYEEAICVREFEMVYPNSAVYCKFVIQKLDDGEPVPDYENFEMSNVKPMLASSPDLAFVEYNTREFDLKIGEPLREYSSTVYDEVVYDANYLYDLEEDAEEEAVDKCMLIRRVGVNEQGQLYPLAQPAYEAVNIPDIFLVDGTNYIDVTGSYTVNLYAKYVQINDFTKIFATQYSVNTQILQLANSIQLLVAEKVGNDEVVAKINLAVKDRQGIIDITGNQVKITSDKFSLSEKGVITASAGNIAGWIIEQSRLYKYRSGMIANTGDNNVVFYAGANGDGQTAGAKFRVANDGQTTVQLLHVECNSTAGNSNDGIHVYYNGKLGMTYTPWGINFIDTQDTAHDYTLAELTRTSNNDMGLWLEKANKFSIIAGLNDNRTLAEFSKDGYVYLRGDTTISGNLQVVGNSTNVVTTNPDPAFGIKQITHSGNTFYFHGIDGTSYSLSPSDKSLKENIVPTEINCALEVISKIKQYAFDWKENKKHEKIGFIANELYELDEGLAEEVPQGENSKYDILYGNNITALVALCTKAIQELSDENKQLKNKINKLEERLNKLDGGK